MDINEENLQAERVLDLQNYRNLEDYGIKFLTGEACAMSERLLFDLTQEGKEHVERFLGGSVVVKRDTNTNPGAVSSILLHPSVLTDLALNIVWSRRTGADWLIRRPSSIWIATDELRRLNLKAAQARYSGELDELMELLREESDKAYGYAYGLLSEVSEEQGARWIRGQGNTRHPHRGDKNVHAMTGETHPS